MRGTAAAAPFELPITGSTGSRVRDNHHARPAAHQLLLTTRPFSTATTPSTDFAISPARFFSVWVLTNPLSWTRPFTVRTCTSSALTVSSFTNSLLILVVITLSSTYSPVLDLVGEPAQAVNSAANAATTIIAVYRFRDEPMDVIILIVMSFSFHQLKHRPEHARAWTRRAIHPALVKHMPCKRLITLACTCWPPGKRIGSYTSRASLTALVACTLHASL